MFENATTVNVLCMCHKVVVGIYDLDDTIDAVVVG